MFFLGLFATCIFLIINFLIRHKSYLNFAFDEGSGTCQLGLAVNVRPSNETNNPNAYGIKIGNKTPRKNVFF